MMGLSGRQALVVDGDAGRRAEAVRLLERRGFTVFEADDSVEALMMIDRQTPLVMLVDAALTDCERTVALATMLHPGMRILLAAEPSEPVTGSPFPVLYRPIDVDNLDACLGEVPWACLGEVPWGPAGHPPVGW